MIDEIPPVLALTLAWSKVLLDSDLALFKLGLLCCSCFTVLPDVSLVGAVVNEETSATWSDAPVKAVLLRLGAGIL